MWSGSAASTAGFGGELLLGDAVEAVGLAGEGDVPGDIGLLADQLVGLDDESGHVPGDDLNQEKADHRGHGSQHQPAHPGMSNEIEGGDSRSHDEGHADGQHAGDGDVGVGVGDAAKDGVILQKQFEAADIDAQGHHEEKESHGDGNTAPGQGGGAVEAAFDQVRLRRPRAGRTRQ